MKNDVNKRLQELLKLEELAKRKICKKVRYVNKNKAKLALKNTKNSEEYKTNTKKQKSTYYCTQCKAWHLSSHLYNT